MKIGTRTILFGVHQFVWHPVTVWLAFHKLYRRWPSWWETVGIVCHDLGYWGRSDIDGAEGRGHPVPGARLAAAIVGFFSPPSGVVGDCYRIGSERSFEVFDFCIGHSREMVKTYDILFGAGAAELSKLCWADKYSIFFEPEWFYLLRARLSGEIQEFKQLAIKGGYVPASATDREWLHWYKGSVAKRKEITELLTKPRPVLPCCLE